MGAVFSFATAGEIRFGRGTADGAADWAAGRARSVALVHGRDAARAAWLRAALEARGLAVTAIAAEGEPVLAAVEAAVAAVRAAGAGAVVALGGGAAIDTGKAVAALVPSPSPATDHLEVVGRGLPLRAEPLPFAALPTTAGTGAEVTRNAVIGVPEHRRKVSLRDRRMLPDLALVDPALTDGTPWSVTLASGLDAVTQVIEPYVSPKANPLTDALCRDAIPRGLRALLRLAEAEDRQARDAMAWVSLCGGLALANAGLGAVHGLAGVLGGRTGAPHGAICGRLLPGVLAANRAAAEGPGAARLREVEGWIAKALGVAPAEAVPALAGWCDAQGLPRLAAMGLRAGDCPEVAEAAGASSSMRGNPVALPARTLVEVLRAAL